MGNLKFGGITPMIGGGFAIDPNALADNVGIGGEIASPDFVPQNCDLFRAGLVVLGSEIAAQDSATRR